MAYGTEEAILYPEYSLQYGYNRAEAVTAAINNSVEGVVIMYEIQTGGAEPGNEDYVPAEYTNIIWDLTKAATDAGIVIVAAAGNGAQNLDSSIYLNYMNRGDSGAIIVGAGSPDTSHSKLQFSTFGSRVDVQAWRYNVYTTGYGDQAMVGNDFNQNYTAFSGTSSATPIVTSCVIVLQSYYHQLTGKYLSGIELRNILKTTGIPQGDFSGNIGPFPNMPNAISYINDNLATNNYIEEAKLLLFPNPFEDKITIRLPKSISGEKIIKLYDVKGRQILTSTMNSYTKTIATDNLANGVYFLHVHTSDKIFTKKIVK
ncbi:S8/S53 family peptidase [Mesonia maritima]|uniref:Subtilisin family serine protease n=1 Tax=Mesonia maritima TaxID=1793873 RepID=A0ABU1K8H9_9FLAO|nr:S8/S53 family peptidase [Mesonia maritima]MDR6301919.1 subtilisin family serine protease [Mesonia maritima]